MKPINLSHQIVSETDYSRMGGKAANLGKLLSQGFPVPAGFVLFEKCSDISELSLLIQQIGGFPVAVRSSGSLEDMKDASFAGLYETYLFIKSEEQLKKSIDDCFDSLSSARVLDYLHKKNISYDQNNLKMSVLVQRMIDARIAGVLFTINPISGKEEELYLELCEGVGERLVSGHVTPTRIVYNWQADKLISENINAEQTRISPEQLSELARISVSIQAYFGQPQDIEWAIGSDEKVYILQSRPVTVTELRTDTPELTNADLKDGGVSARVCTPMMYSLYRDALQVSMGNYFKAINLIQNDESIKWIHFYYGRVYWNAEAVKEGLKKIPGYNEEKFDQDIGIQKDYGLSGPFSTPTTLSTIVNAIPTLLNLHREFLDCQNMIRHFRVSFEETDLALKGQLKLVGRMSDMEFSSWLMKVIIFQNQTEKAYFRTIYNNSNYQSEYKNFLRKQKGYQEGDEVDLMGELQGVAHLDVQSGLRILKKTSDFYGFDSNKYYSDREKFLSYHYHHGPAELDLTTERWGERKDWVDDLVKNFQETENDGVSKYHSTFNRLSEEAGIFKRGSFEFKTAQSREYLRLREEMRSFSTRAYYLIRIGLLELGKRQNLKADQIFFYDIKEIKQLIQNNVPLPDITKRKQAYDGYRKFKAPNEFGGSIKQIKTSLKDGQLKGIGCSPGEFKGRARVITDIHQTGDLDKNDILVTLFTDPGWTPVLARVGGVITEVGGLLSHAAVIGREYRIPAILNLIDATELIQDGDLISMNGKTGIVEILEKSSKS